MKMNHLDLRQYWPALTLAVAAIIAGGLLSAATARFASQQTAWATAYLVLVLGVGTGGLAVGRNLLSSPSSRRIALEFSSWVSGNALVLIGTLTSLKGLLEAGSGLLLLSLISLLMGVGRDGQRGYVRILFLTLVAVLLISIPIGIGLSYFGS